ncbi:flippase [Marinomonas polaris]|uniref:flippase n=1 Tax=Marinomonas polaris TaxID=293552 RepID=UPI003F99EBA3
MHAIKEYKKCDCRYVKRLSILIKKVNYNFQLLRNHTGFMKYFKNTSWLFGEKILRMVVGLFVGIWVARYLGPEQFGLFNYAQSFVGLFAVIATLGLDGVVIRELVKDESRYCELIGTAFFLKLMGALCVLVMLAIAINFTKNNYDTNVLIFIIASSTIFQSFNVIDFYFQSKVLSKYVVYANVISLFASSIVKIVLILSDAPLIAFAWVVFFDSIVLSMGLMFYFYRKFGFEFKLNRIKFKYDRAVLLLKDSWPLILSGIASIINMRIDQVMLGNISDFNTVGNYSAAVRLSELWFILPAVIGGSIYPSFVAVRQSDFDVYKKRIFLITKIMLCLSVSFALIVTFLSDFIVFYLYGLKYAEAASYLKIHIWSGVPYLSFFIFSQVAIIENLTKISLYCSVYAVISNIALNSIFIPSYGGGGAASTTLFVASTSVLLTVYIVYKRLKL